MGLTRSQFKHILNIIDQRRLKNQQIHYARKDKVYKAYPVLQTIDEQISSLSASLTRQIVENPTRRQELLTDLQEKISHLSEQKKETLLEAGYPSDYLAPIYDCMDCKDTGYIDHAKCHCLNQEIINFSYEQSHLNTILQKENFDNFSLDHYSSEVDKNIGKSPREIAAFNYKICYNFADHFDTKYNNLILYGQAGLGKTYLCNCIAKSLLDTGHTVIYLTAFGLFKLLETYRFHNEEGHVTLDEIQNLYECDLLIIDDLGTEINNAFTTSELFNIINTRMLDKKPVVISTNLPPSAWSNQYTDRIVSRIYGNYLSVGFIGSDIRLQKFL